MGHDHALKQLIIALVTILLFVVVFSVCLLVMNKTADPLNERVRAIYAKQAEKINRQIFTDEEMRVYEGLIESLIFEGRFFERDGIAEAMATIFESNGVKPVWLDFLQARVADRSHGRVTIEKADASQFNLIIKTPIAQYLLIKEGAKTTRVIMVPTRPFLIYDV